MTHPSYIIDYQCKNNTTTPNYKLLVVIYETPVQIMNYPLYEQLVNNIDLPPISRDWGEVYIID